MFFAAKMKFEGLTSVSTAASLVRIGKKVTVGSSGERQGASRRFSPDPEPVASAIPLSDFFADPYQKKRRPPKNPAGGARRCMRRCCHQYVKIASIPKMVWLSSRLGTHSWRTSGRITKFVCGFQFAPAVML